MEGGGQLKATEATHGSLAWYGLWREMIPDPLPLGESGPWNFIFFKGEDFLVIRQTNLRAENKVQEIVNIKLLNVQTSQAGACGEARRAKLVAKPGVPNFNFSL